MSVYIIAEAGVNHNGSMELAKKMVDMACYAGADCIKFQTFVSEKIVSRYAQKAEYQKNSTDSSESQLEMLSRLELTFEEFTELKNYCDESRIDFMSTGFDMESLEFLEKLNMEKYKIPSGEITNLPYLIKTAQAKKPVILSTGMSTMQEIEVAVSVLRENSEGLSDITVLHCTTEYPAPYDEVNLRAMESIKKKFNVDVGYSDHTQGIEVPIAAVALGASVLEKHFTLDRNMEGPDHKASLEPDELKKMVKAIRNVEAALGDGCKKPTESEKKNIQIARKSIVASRHIAKGEVFSEGNITVKRPGKGISPMRWFEVLGKVAGRDFSEDELIEL